MLTGEEATVFGLLVAGGIFAIALGIWWLGGRKNFIARFRSYAFGATVGAILFVILAVMLAPLFFHSLARYIDLIAAMCSTVGGPSLARSFQASLEYTIPAAVVCLGMTVGALVVWRKRRRRE